ncbi:hypothetical protein [Streptomyces sp. NPDC059816]|uniref:DinB/UmuC family translesion DNA polymerase n=1 Tax=Streptomyces sp. NPDC059816 TaxID=3346960 RepID=UPI003662265E
MRALVEQVAWQLRADGQAAGRVELTVWHADGSATSRGRGLGEPTAHAPTLAHAASALYDALGLQRARVRGVHLRAADLRPAGRAAVQMTFDRAAENARVLETVADRARARWGPGIIRPPPGSADRTPGAAGSGGRLNRPPALDPVLSLVDTEPALGLAPYPHAHPDADALGYAPNPFTGGVSCNLLIRCRSVGLGRLSAVVCRWSLSGVTAPRRRRVLRRSAAVASEGHGHPVLTPMKRWRGPCSSRRSHARRPAPPSEGGEGRHHGLRARRPGLPTRQIDSGRFGEGNPRVSIGTAAEAEATHPFNATRVSPEQAARS